MHVMHKNKNNELYETNNNIQRLHSNSVCCGSRRRRHTNKILAFSYIGMVACGVCIRASKQIRIQPKWIGDISFHSLSLFSISIFLIYSSLHFDYATII